MTRLTAEGGDKLNLDVRVEPDNEAGGGSNKNTIQAQSYQREWETTVKDALISIDGQLKDNQMRFSSQTKVLTEGGTTEDGDEKGHSQGCKGCYDYYIDWNRLQE